MDAVSVGYEYTGVTRGSVIMYSEDDCGAWGERFRSVSAVL